MRDDVLYVMKVYKNTYMFYINKHYFLKSNFILMRFLQFETYLLFYCDFNSEEFSGWH